MTKPHTRLYPTLSQTFFKSSITATRSTVHIVPTQTRLTDYCRALANGDATLGHVPLSKAYCAKLAFHRELTSSLFIMCQTATLWKPKSTGAKSHMTDHVIAGIFADFDAGMTIEAIAATTGLLVPGGGCAP
jgi:hypothetical protein